MKNPRSPWRTATPRSKASRCWCLPTGRSGVQHAAMAIYNAYCDRVPVYLILGNIVDDTKRVPGVEWAHSVQDAAAMVRDFTKWDDLPVSLTHFARIRGARLQNRDDAADDARGAGGGRRAAGKSDLRG